MIFKKSLGLLPLIFLVACASSSSKPVPKETQVKIDQAQFRTKPELVRELVVVIESSDLKSDEKADLIGKFEKFVHKMAVNLIEQNKMVSAFINNLSSTDHKGMKTKAELIKGYQTLDRDSHDRRVAMINEIGNKLQGKISAENIEKINILLNVRRFLIIEDAMK